MQEPLILVVQGPTASGKTNLAISLAQHFNTEIISFDSRQFYKEMSIGTAVPSEQELSAVKHHFIQHTSYANAINAAEFAKLAQPILNELIKKFGVVVLVGGSALFADALLLGLDDLPHDPSVQEKWQTLFKEYGLAYLQEQLKRLDSAYFEVMDTQNSRRLIRALEIVEITGKSNLDLRNGFKAKPSNLQRFVIDWPRDQLYERIHLRVDQMLAEGLAQEATQLFNVHQQYKTLQTVGYTEFFDFWKGEIKQEQVSVLIKQHTRNYAKRQLTWMRRYPEVHYLDPLSSIPLDQQALDQIG
ncbi:MAG: tRNA (adenosine(37)-N6)-dimethylallyltransferase MiaA [Flavobacteriales bacterium]